MSLMDYLVFDVDMSDYRVFDASVTRVRYNHSVVFPFETMLNKHKDYFMYHWLTKWHWSIPLAFFYLLFVKTIERFMKNRTAFELRGFLIFWNLILAVFSAFGAVRSWEELIYTLRYEGVYQSLCHSYYDSGPAPHWYFFFAISKVVEFGDTVLLALRKRPLSFLHCYHHMSVLVITVQSGSEQMASGRWFLCMNFAAHAVMYTYFTFVSCGVKVPKRIAACVTTIQITQLLMGVVISFAVLGIKALTDWKCQQSYVNLGMTFFVYITYSILFIQFFKSAYLSKKEKTKKA